MSFIIREATFHDVASLREIYTPYIQTTTYTFEYDVPSLTEFRSRFLHITQKYPWLACISDDTLIGYAYADAPFSLRPAYAWSADLSVYLRPEAQRKGVGTMLYHALIRKLTGMGYKTVYAVVTGENTVSCEFHRRLGFREIGRMTNAGYKFDRWLDVVWFEKQIAPYDHPQSFPVTQR